MIEHRICGECGLAGDCEEHPHAMLTVTENDAGKIASVIQDAANDGVPSLRLLDERRDE